MALQSSEGLSPRYLRSGTIRNAAAPPSQRGRRGRPERDAMAAPHKSAEDDHVAPSPPAGAGMGTPLVVPFLLLAPLSRRPLPSASGPVENAAEMPHPEPSTDQSSSDTSLSDTSCSDSCSSSTELPADSGSSSRGVHNSGTLGDDTSEGSTLSSSASSSRSSSPDAGELSRAEPQVLRTPRRGQRERMPATSAPANGTCCFYPIFPTASNLLEKRHKCLRKTGKPPIPGEIRPFLC
ncbi:putative protein TPRXL [Dermacentor silvarum]|uniref:putative protein TPRXL n=1 Tax=Dermacentor silvarum TaxID=543639 RepID=UPI0021008BAD|nr:putative protein TPRXL [Dermacentor silvarum]